MKVGDKIKGFKFENIIGVIRYDKKMDKFINKIGNIVNIYENYIVVDFVLDGYEWCYPKSQAEKYLIKEENETPKHYKTDNNFDVIDFCKMYNLNFLRGNIIKYVCRAGKKDDEIKDLEKALDYLQRELKYLKDER